MYEDVIVTLLGLAIVFFLLIVLVLLVYMWSRINVLETKVKMAPKSKDKSRQDSGGGDLMGYRGKEIWDVLQSSSAKEKNIEDIRKRYAFTLSRHIEQVIDQGQLDSQKGRAAIPGSTATIGGVRGEIESWLPILEIDKLSISFFTRLRDIPAVMDFSVIVQPGEAVGLVGESGCGKSTVALGAVSYTHLTLPTKRIV